ncbi:MAG: hypothetical protein ACHQJ7_09930, partial [Vicinamibacteria bacterium]
VGVLAHRQRARVAQEARRDALLEDRQLRIAGDVEQRDAELGRERVGIVAPRRSPESCCRRRARSSEPWSSLPRSMRISPRRFTGSGIDGTGS